MQVRLARHTARLEAVVHFYRDGLGLPELGRFEDHDGWDGVFLDLPDGNAHLEFTSGGGVDPPESHGESMLVLYLGDERAVEVVRARLGADPVEPANPYWSRNAVTLHDPDGFPVVLVPAAWP